MRVPNDARPVHSRDEAHAGLDQPPGQQVGLTPTVPAVTVTNRRRLTRQVERVARLLRRYERERFGLVDVITRAGDRRCRDALEPIEQSAALGHALWGEIVRQADARDFERPA